MGIKRIYKGNIHMFIHLILGLSSFATNYCISAVMWHETDQLVALLRCY